MIARIWHRACIVATMACFFCLPSVSQTKPATKISLHDVGAPQFPTGFWLSRDDPHFLHHNDALFWLDSEQIATTFFKGFCCKVNGQDSVKYGAAVFDVRGRRISTHEWIAPPNDAFYVAGDNGTFVVHHPERVDLLASDYALSRQIAFPKGSSFQWSKGGKGFAIRSGQLLTIYPDEKSVSTTALQIAPKTVIIDVYGHFALVGKLGLGCQIGVLDSASQSSWSLTSKMEQGRCYGGVALLSPDEILVASRSRGESKVFRRDGTSITLPVTGGVIGIGLSRIALLEFRRNPLAEKLDMDFGGHKDVSVYDLSTSRVVFSKTIGGQAGAAIAPDGKHIAIIDSGSLLVYDLP